MQEFLFTMYVSFEDFLPYYQGVADKVEVKDSHGRVLWINGRHFRPFVTASGVKGHFKLQIDQDGKFVSLKKLSA